METTYTVLRNIGTIVLSVMPDAGTKLPVDLEVRRHKKNTDSLRKELIVK
jgi:hypothetical protein